MPKLSVCMIVKNEASILANCLESVLGCDELVVVDTGSTDNTKGVASKYTDKIFDFPWIDDFAAARNETKNKAIGDWILSIDADEILIEGGLNVIKDKISNIPPNVEQLAVDLWNGVNDHCRGVRVFRNLPHIHWAGIVHECIIGGDKDTVEATIKYGCSPQHAVDPDRYIRLFTKAIEQEPGNPRYHYYFGRDHWYRGKFQEAITEFNKCLDHSHWIAERAEAYFLRAKCLWFNHQPDEARLSCLHALELNSDFKEAALLMADMSWPHNAVNWRNMAATATNERVLFVRT